MPNVEFTLVRSRRKTIGLYIDLRGKLTVRAPLRTPRSRIEEIVRAKADWIVRKQAEMMARNPQAPVHRYAAGEQFLYLGQAFPLEIDRQAGSMLTFDGHFRLGVVSPAKARALFEAWYKRQAAQHFQQRVAAIASQYGFQYKQVRLSSARTRWGSCSSTGNINLTWRLVLAPPAMIDYVIVHELVHTVEHNHRRAFWAQVAAIVPDYKARMAWLKANGAILVL